MRRVRFVALIAGIIVFGLSGAPGLVSPAHAQSGNTGKPDQASAELTVDVPAKGLRGVRLRNLPKGAHVAARIVTNGEVTVYVVDGAAFERRRFARDALFAGRVRDVLTFAFAIPAKANYFLVLDNRTGKSPRKVRISLRARAGAVTLAAELKRLEREFRRLFVDPPPPITVDRCGAEQAVRGGDGITLCREYVEALVKALPERRQAGSLVLFTVVRALGGDLLTRWRNPAAGDDAKLNEFGATLMLMIGQRRPFGRTLAAVAKDAAALAGVERVYRAGAHPNFAEDAARLNALIAKGRGLASWRAVLAPRLRTEVLERLVAAAPKDADLAVFRDELARRQKNKTN